MSTRKTVSSSTKKRKRAVRAKKPPRPPVRRSRGKQKLAAPPEVRRAIPLDYVTIDEVNLRAAPDFAAAKLSGGLLCKGTVVKIAPQAWWYVEVDCPATASGVLRGRVSNSLLRRATEAEEAAKLRQLIEAERYDEAEDYEVIAEYTDLVAKWTTVPSIEAYLRDRASIAARAARPRFSRSHSACRWAAASGRKR